jgi:hypothetical protein
MFKQIKDFLEFYPNSDEAYWTREIEENFVSAKALSDFIGMLVRLSFFSVAIKYFYLKSISSTHSVFLFASFASCLLVMIFLSAALLYKISSIVAGFFLQGVVHQKKKWAKYIIFVLAIVQTALIMNGATQLIDDLAGTHPLEHAMQGKK